MHALMGLTLVMVDAVGRMSDGNDCDHNSKLLCACWRLLVCTGIGGCCCWLELLS